jgi:hypothetical protein
MLKLEPGSQKSKNTPNYSSLSAVFLEGLAPISKVKNTYLIMPGTFPRFGLNSDHLLTASLTGGKIQGLRMNPIYKLL